MTFEWILSAQSEGKYLCESAATKELEAAYRSATLG
jgi:hypothetical protein